VAPAYMRCCVLVTWMYSMVVASLVARWAGSSTGYESPRPDRDVLRVPPQSPRSPPPACCFWACPRRIAAHGRRSLVQWSIC